MAYLPASQSPTTVCDRILDSDQLHPQLWVPMDGDSDIQHLFPERPTPSTIGRCSLHIQASSADIDPLTDSTHPTDLGPQEARFGYTPSHASATPNYPVPRMPDARNPLTPAFWPHSHHPPPAPSSTSSLSSLPLRHPSTPFDPGYRTRNPASLSRHTQLQFSPRLPTDPPPFLYSSPGPSYHPHLDPPAQPRLLPPSNSLHTSSNVSRVSPVSAVPAPAVKTPPFPSCQSRAPIYGTLHCTSSPPCNDPDMYGAPFFESDSIHWNSPPTSSDLPVTPPDHIFAPPLPSSQLRPPSSPHLLTPPSMPALSLSPTHARARALTRARATFPTGKEERFAHTQASLTLNSKSSPSDGTRDVFLSLKRRRLPVAASFSRPKPRMPPVKKVLPKIHGCMTCGKMFDRPSTLLVHQASHTKSKDYACNKCRKAFSVNSNMRRHWRICNETPKDYSVPSSPSAPIKTESLLSPSPHPSSSLSTNSPPIPSSGPPHGPVIPTLALTHPHQPPPGTHSGTYGIEMQSLATSSGPPALAVSLPPDIASQPPSLHRFRTSLPEIVKPLPPVQPRMTKTQEYEMRGWFLPEIWKNVVERWRRWRDVKRGGGTGSCPVGTSLSETITTREEHEDEEDNEDIWGEERDSWAGQGYAPYFGGHWKGTLPGPGAGELPVVSAIPLDIIDDDDEEAAG